MQNNQKYSDILNLVKTKEDYLTLTNELNLLSAAIYELQAENFTQVMSEVSLPTSSLIKNFLPTTEKGVVIEALKKELTTIQFMEITLAKTPSQKLVDTILSWLSDKVSQKVALDITINPLLIGGATISFAGKFFDGSLLLKLENILKNYH